MSSINEKLEYLNETKTAIKEAIVSKGVEVSDTDTFRSYADKINALQVGGKDMLQAMVDNINSCSLLFGNYTGNSLDLSRLDTSRVTSFNQMFYYCSNLQSLDLSNFDTRNVTNMNSMFASCKSLQSVDLSSFDTSNVTLLSSMFTYCESLQSLDLSSFDTRNVTNMNDMFYNCTGLKSLDLSSFYTDNLTNMTQMFYSCSNLETINMSNFDTSKVTSMNKVFRYCTSLTDILGNIDLYSATNVTDIFRYCTKLTNLTLKNIRITLQIVGSLTVDSLVNTIKELWDYSSETTSYTLTMGSTNKVKLANVYVKLITPTAEQIEADEHINSKMPCEVCESTDEGAMLIEDYATLKGWTLA